MTAAVHEFDAREGGSFRISLTYDAPIGAGKTTARSGTYRGRFYGLSRRQPLRQPRCRRYAASADDGGRLP